MASTMAAMPMMHEHVPQWTGEEDEEGEIADDVRTVASQDQPRRHYRDEHPQEDGALRHRRPPQRVGRAVRVVTAS